MKFLSFSERTFSRFEIITDDRINGFVVFGEKCGEVWRSVEKCGEVYAVF